MLGMTCMAVGDNPESGRLVFVCECLCCCLLLSRELLHPAHVAVISRNPFTDHPPMSLCGRSSVFAGVRGAKCDSLVVLALFVSVSLILALPWRIGCLVSAYVERDEETTNQPRLGGVRGARKDMDSR